MDRLEWMQSFARTVETGSFSAVAREQNTTQPTISKQIAALEAYLDVQLLQRSTRTLKLTEEGARFYEHCQRVLEVMSEAKASIGKRQNPSGLLRISCSVAFGEYVLVPLMPAFLAQYPDIKIDLLAADEFVNLVEAGVDVAVRVGTFQDPTLVHQSIGCSKRVVIAKRTYFEQFGIPQTPQDLTTHNCLIYSHLSTFNEWYFAQRNSDTTTTEIVVKVNGRFQTASSALMHHAIKAGLGIAFVPSWLFSEGFSGENLQIVLQAYQPNPTPIRAVYRRGRFIPAKIRCFIDFLTHSFSQNQCLCE
jgi:DNA-binding transcriptional LysR family regulator